MGKVESIVRLKLDYKKKKERNAGAVVAKCKNTRKKSSGHKSVIDEMRKVECFRWWGHGRIHRSSCPSADIGES